MKNLLLLFAASLCTTLAWGQADDVPMADQLRADGKIWVVVVSLVLMLAGFLFYLIRLDGKISKLENSKLENKK